MNKHLFVIIALMPEDNSKFGVVIANTILKESLPFTVKSTMEEARKAGLALSKFFDCELVEAPGDAVGIVSWNPEEKQNGYIEADTQHTSDASAGPDDQRFSLPLPYSSGQV